jgi:hypothetical protein
VLLLRAALLAAWVAVVKALAGASLTHSHWPLPHLLRLLQERLRRAAGP